MDKLLILPAAQTAGSASLCSEVEKHSSIKSRRCSSNHDRIVERLLFSADTFKCSSQRTASYKTAIASNAASSPPSISSPVKGQIRACCIARNECTFVNRRGTSATDTCRQHIVKVWHRICFVSRAPPIIVVFVVSALHRPPAVLHNTQALLLSCCGFAFCDATLRAIAYLDWRRTETQALSRVSSSLVTGPLETGPDSSCHMVR